MLHPGQDLVDSSVNLAAVFGTNLQLYRLATGRAFLLLAKCQDQAGQVSGALAHLIQDHRSAAALVPVNKLKLDSTNHICGQLAACSGQTAGIEGFDFWHAEQALFDLTQDGIFFIDRQIAAGPHPYLCRLRLD